MRCVRMARRKTHNGKNNIQILNMNTSLQGYHLHIDMYCNGGVIIYIYIKKKMIMISEVGMKF